jgi:CheY-like chemotaxis protein
MGAAGTDTAIETADIVVGPAHTGVPPHIDPGSYAVVAVTDTGLGMSRETSDKAFEPFFSTKPADKGTGLGLSMVYGFIAQSGGYVSVESAEGAGTTVRLYLPHTGTDSPPPTAPADSSSAGGAGRGSEVVLLVEDEPDLRSSVAEMLRAAGYKVWTAGEVAGALGEMEKAEPVDLLLSDVVLDRAEDGQELARAARHRHDSAVLFMSGFAGEKAREDNRRLADAPLLRKPVRRRELIRRVRQAIDAHARRHA